MLFGGHPVAEQLLVGRVALLRHALRDRLHGLRLARLRCAFDAWKGNGPVPFTPVVLVGRRLLLVRAVPARSTKPGTSGPVFAAACLDAQRRGTLGSFRRQLSSSALSGGIGTRCLIQWLNSRRLSTPACSAVVRSLGDMHGRRMRPRWTSIGHGPTFCSREPMPSKRGVPSHARKTPASVGEVSGRGVGFC